MDDELEPVKMPLLRTIRLETYFWLIGAWFWLRHATLVHIFRLTFCRHCSGYFHPLAIIHWHDDDYCGQCYAYTFGVDDSNVKRTND